MTATNIRLLARRCWCHFGQQLRVGGAEQAIVRVFRSLPSREKYKQAIDRSHHGRIKCKTLSWWARNVDIHQGKIHFSISLFLLMLNYTPHKGGWIFLMAQIKTALNSGTTLLLSEATTATCSSKPRGRQTNEPSVNWGNRDRLLALIRITSNKEAHT